MCYRNLLLKQAFLLFCLSLLGCANPENGPQSFISATIDGVTYYAGPYSDYSDAAGYISAYAENREGWTSDNCWWLTSVDINQPGTYGIGGSTDISYLDPSGAAFEIMSGSITVTEFPSNGRYLQATFSGSGRWTTDISTNVPCQNGTVKIYRP